MDKSQQIIQTVENIQKKYKNYKNGSITLSEECVDKIKCPKSFKIDSFCEINTGKIRK